MTGRKSGMRSLLKNVADIAGIVLLVLAAKTAIAEPYYVPSGSMEPTLMIGDELLASKFPYGYGAASLPSFISLPGEKRIFGALPERGDVVVFRWPGDNMLAGQHDPKEIIASVKNGLYAVSFGGGQVDITSGKYVFQCTEAYKIENGKVTAPVKGAMLIGNGPTDLHRISMIGNDFALDPGIGTCGKNGQGVPVGVGQPSLRMDKITVGGTA